jgi:integrase
MEMRIMSAEINVIVVTRKGRNFYLRYTDPVTGQKVEKSSGTKNRREATKRAGQWQTDLENGVVARDNRLSWSVFRDAYQDYAHSSLAEKTAAKTLSVFNVIEDTMKPDRVNRITPQWVTRLQKRLLDAGRRPATIESQCRHLKAAMNWAKDQGLISTVPKFNKLKKAKSAKQMKGRAVTGEEFDRLLAAVDSELKERQHESMKFLLRGLWLSGLRLGEALLLTWDQWADGIRVDLEGEYAVLLIPGESEKGGQDRTYPLTPDFEELLLSVPSIDRVGMVFNPVLYRGVCHRMDTVSKVISGLGDAANIKVDEQSVKNPETGKAESKVVWASAHDLRRAFGERWARRVMPMVLKELMRHATVTTTEKYYVGINAQETARFLREVTPTKKGLSKTLKPFEKQ